MACLLTMLQAEKAQAFDNKGAVDNYDTVFCIGDFQIDEIRRQEELYHTKEKNLVVAGYPLLETLYVCTDGQAKLVSSFFH